MGLSRFAGACRGGQDGERRQYEALSQEGAGCFSPHLWKTAAAEVLTHATRKC